MKRMIKRWGSSIKRWGSSGNGGGSPTDERGWSWPTGAMGAVAVVAVGTASVLTLGAEGDAAAARMTRVEIHAAGLASGGGAADDVAERWLAAADQALADPAPVRLPFEETDQLPPGEIAAVGYAFPLRAGQVIEATVDASAPGCCFVELHRIPGADSEDPAFVAEADSAAAGLSYEIRTDGEYVLRVLPAPFVGGPYDVGISTRPALPFPVSDRDPGSIISRWGAPRDGGARSHEGVDIIAPAGTPVLAVTTALVYDVGTSGRGGNYVWLQDWGRGMEVYYAHLQESWVRVGMVVEPGDQIGSVGNTGNAETTAPHLHFGIYDLDRRPSDPLPYIAPVVTD